MLLPPLLSEILRFRLRRIYTHHAHPVWSFLLSTPIQDTGEMRKNGRFLHFSARKAFKKSKNKNLCFENTERLETCLRRAAKPSWATSVSSAFPALPKRCTPKWPLNDFENRTQHREHGGRFSEHGYARFEISDEISPEASSICRQWLHHLTASSKSLCPINTCTVSYLYRSTLP